MTLYWSFGFLFSLLRTSYNILWRRNTPQARRVTCLPGKAISLNTGSVFLIGHRRILTPEKVARLCADLCSYLPPKFVSGNCKLTKSMKKSIEIFLLYIHTPTEWTATFLDRLFLYVSSYRVKSYNVELNGKECMEVKCQICLGISCFIYLKYLVLWVYIIKV